MCIRDRDEYRRSRNKTARARRKAGTGTEGAVEAYWLPLTPEPVSYTHLTLLDICNAVDVPVVAIGGIHKENILQLKGTGVDGVALVSAIFAAKDIEAECRELRVLSEQIIK